MLSKPSILVVDDDPAHLRIYSWIMNAAGFHAVTAQVHSSDVSLPADGCFDVIVLDYRLTGTLTAVEAAQQLKGKYPNAPLVILSDVFGMPDDVAPYAQRFVRKGDPEKLIATIRSLVTSAAAAAADPQ